MDDLVNMLRVKSGNQGNMESMDDLNGLRMTQPSQMELIGQRGIIIRFEVTQTQDMNKYEGITVTRDRMNTRKEAREWKSGDRDSRNENEGENMKSLENKEHENKRRELGKRRAC